MIRRFAIPDVNAAEALRAYAKTEQDRGRMSGLIAMMRQGGLFYPKNAQVIFTAGALTRRCEARCGRRTGTEVWLGCLKYNEALAWCREHLEEKRDDT